MMLSTQWIVYTDGIPVFRDAASAGDVVELVHAAILASEAFLREAVLGLLLLL